MGKTKTRLALLLEQEDRNANWLSKKLGCSHTLVYNWCKGKGNPNSFYKQRISTLFNIPILSIFNTE